jgi:hypothetical protein
MEDGPNLLQVSKEGRDKRSVGLMGFKFFGLIGVLGQDGGTGNSLLGHGVIFGVFVPKGMMKSN